MNGWLFYMFIKNLYELLENDYKHVPLDIIQKLNAS